MSSVVSPSHCRTVMGGIVQHTSPLPPSIRKIRRTVHHTLWLMLEETLTWRNYDVAVLKAQQKSFPSCICFVVLPPPGLTLPTRCSQPTRPPDGRPLNVLFLDFRSSSFLPACLERIQLFKRSVYLHQYDVVYGTLIIHCVSAARAREVLMHKYRYIDWALSRHNKATPGSKQQKNQDRSSRTTGAVAAAPTITRGTRQKIYD